jgi:O-phosphoseryl-tRNA synthetase
MKININNILKRVKKEGFEKVWIESAKVLPKAGRGIRLVGEGKAHPVFDIMEKMRHSYLNMGFDETLTPIIIEDEEVYRQYGPEAPIILDRCYYLAGLPRPDIGISKEKQNKIEEMGVRVNNEKIGNLQRILREYKKGDIDSDDLVEKIGNSLGVDDTEATKIIETAFQEFKSLKPITSSLTLRSHMTSAWFGTLKAIQHKISLPIKLFTVHIRFRREQSEDSTHLKAHHGASCVVMDEDVTVEDGKEIARTLLTPFDLKEIKFIKKRVSSKYYAPDTEFEGFIWLPKKKRWVEIVDFGLYSPIALAKYGIEYPVMNLGLGIERLGMIIHDESDIRRLSYPQFYSDWKLSDKELASMVRIESIPTTDLGRKIYESIVSTALMKAEEPSPCEFLAFQKRVDNKKVNVWVYEKDVNKRLLGPAALNRIYIYQGNILGIPEKGLSGSKIVNESREGGIPTDIRFIDSVASLAAYKIEEALEKKETIDIRVGMAKLASDVNIRVSEVAQHYITSNKKRIIVKGPVFIGIKSSID